MTKEDKELLFQDLCARLPYHVRLKVWLKEGPTEEGFLDLEHNYEDVLRAAFYYNDIKDIKPYLRPMLSMTEEEKKDFLHLTNWDENDLIDIIKYPHMYEFTISIKAFDWLNKNHFDYRGLIPKKLAIEVNKENNPYKE